MGVELVAVVVFLSSEPESTSFSALETSSTERGSCSGGKGLLKTRLMCSILREGEMRGKLLLVLRRRRIVEPEFEEPSSSSLTSFLLDFGDSKTSESEALEAGGDGDEVLHGANEDSDASMLLLRVRGERQKVSPKPLSADDVRGGSEIH